MGSLLIFVVWNLFSLSSAVSEDIKIDNSYFGAHVSRINSRGQLIRFRTDYPNLKYLTQGDEIKFWTPNFSKNKCLGRIQGKTAEHFLIYVPNYHVCSHQLYLSVGTYVHIASDDLVKNMKMGEEVNEILFKKRLAVQAKKDRTQKELDSHVEKVEATNKRYEVLRQKLELEWKKELSNLDEDKVTLLQNYKELESQVRDIDFKMEQYKVVDDHMEVDRWALDPRLYFKK